MRAYLSLSPPPLDEKQVNAVTPLTSASGKSASDYRRAVDYSAIVSLA
jgi:hypothetical protein